MGTKTKVLIDIDAEKLKRVIEMAKRGTMCKSDHDLINWLEWKLNNCQYQIYTADYQEMNLDEIPF